MSNTSLPLLSSAVRITPPCVHFSEGCGGCALQDYAYEDQLRAKEAHLNAFYSKDVPLIASENELGYRSRMDYVLAFKKKGLRKRGDHRTVIDTPHCLLLPANVRPIYLAVCSLIDASGLPDHDYIDNTGYLRYLVIRTSISTGETMLILTTGKPPEDETPTKELLASLASIPGVTSAWWTVNDNISDKSVAEPKEHRGFPTITEEIAGVHITIGPKTFSQGNAIGAGVLFERAIAHVKGAVLDLCCGVGILGILAAKQDVVTSVIGVDIVEESIVAARENAKQNDVKIEFLTQDLTQYLKDCAQQEKSFDTVLCDPARPGLGLDACALLLKLEPERIVYISCNPSTHRSDLAILSKKYDVTLLEGHDLFPQTPHIEMLSVLEKKR